jgi:hypothetical protein
MLTGLAGNLLTARQNDQTGLDTALPEWRDRQNFLERNLNILFSSGQSIERLLDASKEIGHCRGEALANGLFRPRNNGSDFCAILSLGNRASYIAQYTEELLLHVSCREGYSDHCEVSIPYQSFAPTISFGTVRLRDWKAIVAKAILFLDEHQYK